MTTPTGIAVAQFAPTTDAADNRAAIAALARRAVERGATVVLFPEYSSFFTDPFDETLAENAESLDGPFVQALTALAAELGAHLVAGLTERAGDGERVHNTVVAVDGSGIVALYRKLHLYDAFGQRESDWVEAGRLEEPQTFEAGGMRFGLMTCYDLRFPEAARVLADAEVDVALVPAEWVRGPLKEHHWTTLLAARAIENTMYVAAADHPPTLGVGHSAVIDPQGVTIAALGTATDVAVGWADRDTIRNVRRVNPALQLRRYRVVPR
jgi:predicted amidohydrolase